MVLGEIGLGAGSRGGHRFAGGRNVPHQALYRNIKPGFWGLFGNPGAGHKLAVFTVEPEKCHRLALEQGLDILDNIGDICGDVLRSAHAGQQGFGEVAVLHGLCFLVGLDLSFWHMRMSVV